MASEGCGSVVPVHSELSKSDLVALMAAIIFAGADAAGPDCGYTPEGAVKKAMLIRKAVEDLFFSEDY